MTKIEWCTHTVNPLVGCSRTSPACDHCYAMAMARRHQAMGTAGYEGVVENGKWTGRVNFVPKQLEKFASKKPKRIFVGSMSDLFHPNVGYEWRVLIWRAMMNNPQHTYYILTKRPQNIPTGYNSWLTSPAPNIFLGVTVESADYLHRIDELCRSWSGRKFVSMEPLLGAIDTEYPKEIYPDGPPMCCDGRECGCRGLPIEPPLLYGLDWVIVGGESGPGAHPLHPDWVRSIRDQCVEAGVPFFLKQNGEWAACGPLESDDRYSGGQAFEDADGGRASVTLLNSRRYHQFQDGQIMNRVGKKAAGRLLDGKEWSQIPEVER